MRQQGTTTVGDTITIVRQIAATPGAVVTARPPVDSAVATLVGPAIITREGDSIRIAYPLAVWAAGHSDLVLPGVVVIDQRGHVDTLADTHVPLDVVSVLPPAKPANGIAPKTARPWLPRTDTTDLPFFVLLPFAFVLIAVLHWWWRRRGPALPRTAARAVPSGTSEERLEAWISAGEAGLALDHFAWHTRQRADLADWRARAAAIRFVPDNEALLADLVREGSRLAAAQPDGLGTNEQSGAVTSDRSSTGEPKVVA